MQKIVYKSMDPLELENRFSSDRNFFYEQEEAPMNDIMPFIEKLPEREQDLIDMYFFQEKNQKEIADYFNVTQGAISHRLSRARNRLKFLRDMPKPDFDLKKALGAHFTPFEVDVLLYMVETTCQSRTAFLLNGKYKLRGNDKMTQVKVRHKFIRFMSKIEGLQKKDHRLEVCFKLMRYIKKNLYMMHEVILPHFDRGYKVRISKLI